MVPLRSAARPSRPVGKPPQFHFHSQKKLHASWRQPRCHARCRFIYFTLLEKKKKSSGAVVCVFWCGLITADGLSESVYLGGVTAPSVQLCRACLWVEQVVLRSGTGTGYAPRHAHETLTEEFSGRNRCPVWAERAPPLFRFCWHSSIKHGNLEEQWVAGAGLHVFNSKFCVFRVIWTCAVTQSVEQTSRRGEEAAGNNSSNSVASKILIRVELATCCWIYALRVTSLCINVTALTAGLFFFFFFFCWKSAESADLARAQLRGKKQTKNKTINNNNNLWKIINSFISDYSAAVTHWTLITLISK